MTTKKLFELSDLHMESFFFIAHLLDGVLIGKEEGREYKKLEEAISMGTVIEVHFFNEQQEVYVVREHEQLVAYKPMKHLLPDQANKVITRSYEMESNKSSLYNTLIVKEYLGYEDNLAYIEQTVLYALDKRERGALL